MTKQNVKQEIRHPRQNSPVIQAVIPNPEDLALIKQAAAINGAPGTCPGGGAGVAAESVTAS